MWNVTKQGLYKKFTFIDFNKAWTFVEHAAQVFRELGQYPRWQNDNNIVAVWVMSDDTLGGESAEHSSRLTSRLDDIYRAVTNSVVETNVVQESTNITEVTLYADGGSRGNPGPSASGFVVLDMNKNVLYKAGVYLGITTNNQAEYQALKLGLEYVLHTFGVCSVHVYMDSQLVVNQMKSIFKVRNRDLWPVHDAILELIQKCRLVTFDHIPRELNKLADAEVNACLDASRDK